MNAPLGIGPALALGGIVAVGLLVVGVVLALRRASSRETPSQSAASPSPSPASPSPPQASPSPPQASPSPPPATPSPPPDPSPQPEAPMARTPDPSSPVPVAPEPAAPPETIELDLGGGPHRDAVEALFGAYAAFHRASAHLAPWRETAGRYWFLESFEEWLLALRDLSTEGRGHVRGSGDDAVYFSDFRAWLDAFADSWLDPAAGALSVLARDAVQGKCTEDEQVFGQALQDLLLAGLPASLGLAGVELVEIAPFVTPFDARWMVSAGTEAIPEAGDCRERVVAVRRVGLRQDGKVLRAPLVTVGAG